MALSKSKMSYLLMSVMPLASMLFGCSERSAPAAGSRSEAAPAYTSTAAYWVVDRIEDADADSIAVLENPETLRMEERSVKDLPEGVKEGRVLIDGGVTDGTLWIDNEETSAREVRIGERFERLKAD